MTTTHTDLLQVLGPMAFEIGSFIRDHHIRAGIGSGHFYGLDNRHTTAWSGERRITMRGESGAEVSLFDLDVEPLRQDDIEIGEMEDDGPQELVRAQTFTSINEMLDAIKNKMTIRDLEASTQDTAESFARDVGLKVALGFEQSVGYGSEMAQIQGESKLRMDVESSLGMAWESSSASSKTNEHEATREREFTEPPMHRTVVDRVQMIGPAKRHVRAKGKVKFGVECYSPGHWKEIWHSRRDMLANMRGIDIPEHRNGFVNLFRNHRLDQPEAMPFFRDVYSVVEHTQRFKDRGKIDVRTRAEPLNDEARVNDALRLIALQTANPDLKALVQAELKERGIE